MSDGSVTVTDDRFPGWRARIVVDEDAGQPWGDTLAPALLIPGCQPVWAGEVYQPQHADRILAAWRHFGTDELFERYLRLAHGTTAIRHVTDRDLTVVIVEHRRLPRPTPGITDVCYLTGEHEHEQGRPGSTESSTKP